MHDNRDDYGDGGVSQRERGNQKKRKCTFSVECGSANHPINQNMPSNPCSTGPEFSSSVSFWWGRRILKE